MNKVSVIIPVYNEEMYLGRCLESVINQTLKEIEIICVDDGSTDNTPHIIKQLSKEDEHVKYISMAKNCGSGPARNKGLETATGQYISFIDSDDFIMEETAYAKLYKFAARNQADMASANLKVYRQENNLENPEFSSEIKEESAILPEEYGIPLYFQKNLYKKSFLDKFNIKFPDYLRGQDHVFLTNVLVHVDLIYCYPLDLYAYKLPLRNKVDSPAKERDFIKQFKDVFSLLKLNGFEKTYSEYEDTMRKFLARQRSSSSLEENIKTIFGENSAWNLVNYKKN